VKIPKPGKKGFRAIAVQNARDRVVGRAAVRILQPVLDPTFSCFSFGCRPKRSSMEALATALALASSQSRWVWIADDVVRAFDRIPFGRFLQACQAHFPVEVVEFITVIAHKGTRRGLRQGNPSSPLFANLFFDFHLDRPWNARHPDLPVIRYLDDVLLLCSSVDEAKIAYPALASQATAIGTPLGSSVETSVFDLTRSIGRLGGIPRWIDERNAHGPNCGKGVE